MSDLGNGVWPNSMKLGKDIDLDELLLNPVLFVCRPIFLSISISQGEGGGSHFGVSEYKKIPV